MKKVLIALFVLFALALAGFFGWRNSRPGPGTPLFQSAQTQPRIGPFKSIYYEFLSPSPFEGGKMWVSVLGATNSHHCFLYDIDRQIILGELLNASPLFMNRDQSKLLCSQWTPGAPSLREWVTALLQRLRHHNAGARSSSDGTDALWVLDLNRHSATRIGKTAPLRSTFQPSPTFRYGFIKSSDYPDDAGFLLCDLESKRLTQLNAAGWPQGWWDERTIVIKDPTNNFVLRNVITGSTSPLWTPAQLAGFFEKMNIPADPSSANLFSTWNGKQNDFYLADLHKKWLAVESFLIKAERSAPPLSLVSKDFKYEWSDHVDPTGRWYLYSGREPGQASSGVFVRDLLNNTTRTLVPSDGGKYMSIPRFYRDGVIYTRSNMLWRINLDGSNQVRLFPPPEAEPAAGGRLER